MVEQEKPEIIETDFKERRVVQRINLTPDAKPVQFLRDMAKLAKKDNIKSVLVLTISESNHVEWLFEVPTEHHLCLAALSLDDIKDELKQKIFQDEQDIGDV